MKKIYAEIGFGNDTFLSTEIEQGDKEYRIPKFALPQKIKEVYFRFWVFKKVYIFSIPKGISIKTKNRNNFKIFFGIGGSDSKTIKKVVIAGSASLQDEVNKLEKIIDDKSIVFPKDDIPKELIEILSKKDVVILGEFHHYIHQHQEFLFNLSTELHQFGFQQILIEGIHAYSWAVEDYTAGKINSLSEKIKCFYPEFLEQIRDFNENLPEKNKIIVKDIDMTHGDNSFVESIMLMSEIIDTYNLFDSLKDADTKSEEYYIELVNLNASLSNYKGRLASHWYGRIEEMIRVEMKSFKIRANELYYEPREKVIINLCKENLSVGKKTIIFIGHNHAQKKHFEGPGKGYQLTGEFVHENYNSYHIGLIGMRGEIKYSFRDLETKKFDVPREANESDLFRVIGEKQEDNNMFLPLDDYIFENKFTVMNGPDKCYMSPKIQFDAYVSFPEIELIK